MTSVVTYELRIGESGRTPFPAASSTDLSELIAAMVRQLTRTEVEPSDLHITAIEPDGSGRQLNISEVAELDVLLDQLSKVVEGCDWLPRNAKVGLPGRTGSATAA